ncbi:flavin reductase (NADPH)-like [Haliotis rufescens]|uniref:flavin reductase (NADPH)-like n=1 Tax=Haliotis rufescens TaxID=6454 RepID=UPI00201E7A22|nr:flavin reductase (NADPH)-like [Haliotis rufescens]
MCKIMKIAIFGATGPSGTLLVEECLGSGHSVVALARNPDKLTIKHENLTVVKSDIQTQEELVSPLTGCDAVMSCLGSRQSIWSTVTLYTDTVKVITGAMRAAGVSRFVAMASWGTKYEAGLPFVIKWILRPLILKNILLNMGQMEDYLAECGDIDYTVVRTAELTKDESTGREVTGVDGQFVPDAAARIPRRDVVRFMMRCVVNGEWMKKCVSIGIK